MIYAKLEIIKTTKLEVEMEKKKNNSAAPIKVIKSKEHAKTPKKALFKKKDKSLNVYSSLNYRLKAKKEAIARKRAEELSKLPKEPVARFFARLHPKRVAKFMFSKQGLMFFLKACAAAFLIGVIAIGGLFLYYKKDLDSIRLNDIKVSESVNVYTDRNGEVLWEDRGDGDYRLVVEDKNIPDFMKQATIAIEDRAFYNHRGVDFSGIIRATFSTLTGRGVQGGSTLTQQLIKQVYFADEASSANRGGLSRKIKEMILAIELEKMYSKDQIITMYLNESPYGGRRNGIESAAQAYFGKTSKDLNLAEAALLASIPNNPAVLNPYNTYGNKALVARQQKTLDVMVEMGYISKEDAEAAKAIDILATIRPETGQYENIKAPHFVLEVKKQLEEKYGIKTMRAGGFTIKTTIDYRAQQYAEEAVAAGAKMTNQNGSDNIALSSVDVETGQVIAMVGSIDWRRAGYGELNATTSLLEPGSSIKPILDYGPLFMQREGKNYGPGTILKDENIDKTYCGGNSGSCKLRNYTGKFYGNITIRKSLANSLNIGAVKALYINGVENSLEVAHELGDWSYCKDRDPSEFGFSIAIGSGCGVRGIEHANAYASISRGGVYKPLAYVLQIKNSSGDIIEQWEDKEGKRVYDKQVAYMISSILSDANARSMVFGAQSYSYGFSIPGVVTASKTGTSTTSNSAVAKDSWLASYSPAVATTVWNGNHDGRGLSNSSNNLVRRVVHNYMENVHKQIYEKDGRWKTNETWTQPEGLKRISVNGQTDYWPSWYNSKTSGEKKETLKFNSATKKLARDCTPESLVESIDVTVMTDPVSGTKVYSDIPEGYDEKEEDSCTYQVPTVVIPASTGSLDSSRNYRFSFSTLKGSGTLNKYTIYLNGTQAKTGDAEEGEKTVTISGAKVGDTIRVVVSDSSGAIGESTTKIR